MILIPAYSGKTVGVLGLGKTGTAAVASLSASGAQVLVWDDGAKEAVEAVAQYGNVRAVSPEAWPWEALAALVLSPGIPYTHPAPNPAVLRAQKAGVPVLGDCELLYQACPQASYIGITGTNGKSTTTALIGHILAHAGKAPQVGGNIGTAALSLSPLGAGGSYVLEMSSYQLDLLCSMRFSIAVHLNLSEDHIDRHGSMEGYFAAKKHLFDRQQPGDVAIIGVDDPWSAAYARELAGQGRRRVVPISAAQEVEGGVYAKDGVLYNMLAGGVQCDLRGIRSLQGQHNGQNAAAAYAACFAHGVAHEVIVEAMQGFPGLAHRMQWLGEVAGVQFVNDSKATNADAAEKALKTYDHIYWILGGVAKEGGIASLAPYFPKVRHAYLIGQAAAAFAAVLDGKAPYTQSGTLEAAFADAVHDAKEGVVLLAPACASFDQFRNFEVRGEAFAQLVERHKDGVR